MSIPAYPTSLDTDVWALAAPILEGMKQPTTPDENRCLWNVFGFAQGQVEAAGTPPPVPPPVTPPEPPPPAGSAPKRAMAPKAAGAFARSGGKASGTFDWSGLVNLILQILAGVAKTAPAGA